MSRMNLYASDCMYIPNSTRLLPYIRISQTMSGAKLHASRTSTWHDLRRTARRSYDTRNELHRSFLENPDYIRKTTTSELYHWRHARALRNSVASISSQITWTTHARSWSKQLHHSIFWSELITKYTSWLGSVTIYCAVVILHPESDQNRTINHAFAILFESRVRSKHDRIYSAHHNTQNRYSMLTYFDALPPH
jgi:hypothetical protein